MFSDADSVNIPSGSSGGGQLDSAGAAAGSGSPGAQSPGGESCRGSSVPATAAEGDGEEDDEEEAAASTAECGLSRSMLAAGLGLLLLAVSLFHLGQQREQAEAAEEAGSQLCLALLLLQLVLYLVCAACAFLLGTLLALFGRSRGRLRPLPDFRAAWNRRYPERENAAPLLRTAVVSQVARSLFCSLPISASSSPAPNPTLTSELQTRHLPGLEFLPGKVGLKLSRDSTAGPCAPLSFERCRLTL